MTKGIVYLAFGAEYTRLAFNTISYSRRFTDLPMAVVTNMPSNFAAWEKIGVKDIFVERTVNENREVKTTINLYSPFDLSLYVDCDAVIQKKGIEQVFELMGDNDVLIQRYGSCRAGKKYFNIYHRAMLATGAQVPFDVYLGGFFAFRKNARTADLFSRWYAYWLTTGAGRDMPAWACAIKNTPGLKSKVVTQNENKLFSFGIDRQCVAVHRSRRDDLERCFKIPQHKQHKPFDQKNNNDWSLVTF